MNEAVLYILENNLNALKDYLNYNSINQVDEKGNNLLHYAIMYNRVEICYFLINSHIFLNQQNYLSMTPLFLAIHKNMIGVCDSLLKNNCDITLRSDKGETPFYYAFLYGREEIIKLFIEYRKADFTQKNQNGENILFALIRNGNLSLLNTYFSLDLAKETDNASNNLLHLACNYNDSDIIYYLLEKGLEVNKLNRYRETPLFNAIRTFNYQAVKVLLQHGALTDFKNRDGLSLKKYLKDSFKTLLNYDYTDKERINYPLHYAVILNDKDMFKANFNEYNYTNHDYFNKDVPTLIKSLGYTHFATMSKEYIHMKRK